MWHRLSIGVGLTFLLITGPSAWARADVAAAEIHEYCGEASAIVIGSPVSYDAQGPTAEFRVESWIKPLPATTQPATSQPTTLHLSGGPRSFKDQTFGDLAKPGRFLVFVFPGGRTGDGRIGSIIEINGQGQLPTTFFLRCLDPQPKTADELVTQIKRVLSKEYPIEQMKILQQPERRDPERAEAARRLGALHAMEAWDILMAEATQPGRDETEAKTRESLLALFRLDKNKTTPICLSMVRDNRHDYQVDTAAWLLTQNPSNDPQAPAILLVAALRWETEFRNDDHPLPNLIQALTVLNHRTPELEALMMRGLKKGSGNIFVTSMYAAAEWNLRQAVPFIFPKLGSTDKTVDLRPSISLALAKFAGSSYTPYRINRQVTQEDARQAATEAFPDWRTAFAQGQTAECCRNDRVIHASREKQRIYILVAWQGETDITEPHLKAFLLYRTDELKLHPATTKD